METMVKEVLLEKPEVKEEIIKYCFSLCSSCGRIVQAKIVKRAEGVYLKRFCSVETRIEKQFIGKDWLKRKYDKIPFNWPKSNIKVGQRYMTLKDVTNLQEVLFVVFHLTKQCNIDCKICFVKDYDFMEEMDLDFIKNKLTHFHNQKIILFGGEPTVREDLPQIIKLVINSGNVPILFTNGVKLADRIYLRKLINSGLRHVCISLDGFDNGIYFRMRDVIDKKIVLSKVQALKNLEKANISVTLQATVYKGVNEGEIKKLLKYALKKRFIKGLWLRPLILNSLTDLTKEYCISLREIEELVCRCLNISEAYFLIWDRFKQTLVKWLADNLSWIRPSVIELGRIYLVRGKDRFSLFLNIEQLNRLTEIFNSGKTKTILKLLKTLLLNPKYFYWLIILAIFRFRFKEVDRYLYKKGIFEVAIRGLYPVKDSTIISENNIVNELCVFANGENKEGIDVAMDY